MATAEQLKALLQSYADGDEARFLSVAMQVAAKEAKLGHSKLAQDLRALIDEVKSRASIAPRTPRQPIPLVQPKGELAGVLSVTYPRTKLEEMVLEEIVRERLLRVLSEQRQHHKLREHGLRPRHRVLLVGPPGSGKTMTASAMAGEMTLPLFTIQLDGLLTKFMGETAAKLRLVFDAIRTTRGVYLFDEFDSIGGHRGSANDIGEIRRVLNSFLQFLEADDSDSLIVAATNNAQLLDEALFRRFDDVIEYHQPTPELAARLVAARLGPFLPPDLEIAALVKTAADLSYAELGRASDDAVKAAILSDASTVDARSVQRAFDERRGARRK
ncbi:MAG: ATP-binding protein [Archangiaceae bacterium]|nr:ATP-binding protein [Archangiaceae bacterium]